MSRRILLASLILSIAGLLAMRSIALGADADSEIRAAIAHFDDAYNSQKPAQYLALYTADSDAIYFEDTIPLQIKGPEAFRKFAAEGFKDMSAFHQKTNVENVASSGDLGVAVCLIDTAWTDSSGSHSDVGRFTAVLKKVGGKWLIWHEHYSLPYDYSTGKVVMNAQP